MNLEITQIEGNKYSFVAVSNVLDTAVKQVDYLEKIAEYLSFLINREEYNPHYGTIFIRIEPFEFRAILVGTNREPFQENIRVSDGLGMSSTRTVNLDETILPSVKYNDLLHFYFDGLRAEHKKSKYFHWFLVLEYLEHSQKYKKLFNNKKLFDLTEAREIEVAANKMSDGTKKGAVLTLLSRTKDSRNSKLLQILNQLSIKNLKLFGKEVELTEETVKSIITGRNVLFHTGSAFPEFTLWNSLFPLVTGVVEYVSCNPGCLD